MECSKKKKIKACSINESWRNGGIFVNNYLTQYNSNLFFESRMFAKEKTLSLFGLMNVKCLSKKVKHRKPILYMTRLTCQQLKYNT